MGWTDVASEHRARLLALGLPPGSAEILGRYLDLVAAWNERVNLTGARTAVERVRVLVGAVLPAVPCLEPGRLIDVGSGNGSPGLVLALLRPDLQATLLEPRQRRWAFLREAARDAGRPDVTVLRLRHDGHEGAPARNVTVRALALPLAALAPLVEPGGQILVFGVRPRCEEPFQPGPGAGEGGGRVPHVPEDARRSTGNLTVKQPLWEAPGMEPPPLDDFARGYLVGLLIGEGHFGGDGRQAQVTLRMHVRHLKVFEWLERTLPGGKLYGPYSHGGRHYYQWMARGKFLRECLIPLIREDIERLDDHCAARVRRMCERYGLVAGEGTAPPSP